MRLTIKERKESMATGKALDGKPYAGNPHVRFDEGEVASAAKPRRGSLLYKMAKHMRVCVLLSVLALAGTGTLNADDITLAQAETAVGNWIARGGGFGKFSRGAVSAKTLEDRVSGAKMHLVKVSGKGFVVTSADDGIEPIVFFSDGDSSLIAEDGNPAWDLLRWDIAARAEALKAGTQNGNRMVGKRSLVKDSPQEKWATLLQEEQSTKTSRLKAASGTGKQIISDIRVSPLVHTEWGQGGVGKNNLKAYNYYTPGEIKITNVQKTNAVHMKGECVNVETNEVGNYPCGCVATAGAQLMKKWEYPTSPSSRKTVKCKRDGEDLVLTMKGGPYKWTGMGGGKPGVEDSQREAVGRVTFDIGVACGAEYSKTATSMSTEKLVEKLREVFKYKSAKWYGERWWEFFNNSGRTGIEEIAIPNINAGAPILLAIRRDKYTREGHCVLADGYGYDNGRFSIHVNFGWNGGSPNAWYVPPVFKVDDKYNYGCIVGIGANIFPNSTGSLVSGRATGANGRSLGGATVELCSMSGSVLLATKTEKNGSYWFQQEPGEYQVRISLGGETDSASITLAECEGETIGNELKDWTITSALSVSEVSAVTSSTKSGAKGIADPTIISAPVSIRLSCATEDAEIHYTLDGTQPTPESPIFDGTITIQDTTTLRAIAYADGMESSELFEQTWMFVDPVSRDNFANARLIDGRSGHASFDNTGYTKEAGEPVHSKDGVQGGTSAWAVWTAPESGDWTFYLAGVITNINESMNTQLAIYTGSSVDALTFVAANDDVNSAEDDYSSRVSFSAKKGETYYIAMDSYRGISYPGTLVLRWEKGFVHYARFDESSFFIPSSGGHVEVMVESSAAWSFVECSDWIVPSVVTGDNGDKVIFDVETNSTGLVRNGYLTIKADNSEFATVSISQHPMDFATTKLSAKEQAWRTNKRILLIYGRETCPNTSSTLLYSIASEPVRQILSDGYVLWYSNCDRQTEASIYAAAGGYTLPLICIIDPQDMSAYVTKTYGYTSASALKQFLESNADWDGLPKANISISSISDTSAAVTTIVRECGTGHSSATVTLEIANDASFTSDVTTCHLGMVSSLGIEQAWSISPPSALRSSYCRIRLSSGEWTMVSGVFGWTMINGSSRLTSVTVADGVTSIGHNSFRDFSCLTYVTIPDSVTSIGSCAFVSSGLSEISIPASVKRIEAGAFAFCRNLLSVTLAEGLLDIEGDAFSGCSKLSTITIPASVLTVGWCAFNGIASVVFLGPPPEVLWNGFSGADQIGGQMGVYPHSRKEEWEAVMDSDGCWHGMRMLSDHDVVKVHFDGNGGMGRMSVQLFERGVVQTLSANTFTRTGYAFTGWATRPEGDIVYSGTQSISIAEDVDLYAVWEEITDYEITTGGVDYEVENGVLVKVRLNGNSDVVVPNGIRAIGSHAFSSGKFGNVEIPDSVASLGDYAFSDSEIENLVLPDSIVSIGSQYKWCLSGCKVKNLTIPIKALGLAGSAHSLFNGKQSTIESLTITDADKLEEIPDGMFSGCSSLSSFHIPETVRRIGGNAFSRTGLKQIALPELLGDIDNNAFSYCTNLTEITIPDSVRAIGAYAFYGCHSLERVIIPMNVVSIGDHAFDNCNSMVTAFVPLALRELVEERDAAYRGLFSYNTKVIYYDGILTDRIYTVTFDAGGGTVDEASRTYTNEVALGVLPMPEWESHIFKGWWDAKQREPSHPGGNFVSQVDENTLVLSDATYYAHWLEVFSLVFDPNGGRIDDELRTLEVECGKYIKTPVPVREKYTFLGWYTEPGGGDKLPSYAYIRQVRSGAYYAHWQYDGKSSVAVCMSEGCESMGSVTGGNSSYKEGSKVALKATADRGYVFVGWYASGDLLSRETSYSYVVSDKDVTITAVFASSADDIASLRIELADDATEADGTYSLDLSTFVSSLSQPKLAVLGLPTGLKYDAKTGIISGKATKPGVYKVTVSATNATVKKPVTAEFEIVVPNLSSEKLPGLEQDTDAYGVVMCGVALDPGLVNCTPEEGWTVKVAGLPAGLKFTAKDIMKKGSKTEVDIPANTIYGVPTAKPGAYTVTFTATKGKEKQTATITLNVEALPTWVTGMFAGNVTGARGARPYHGLATMTVAANGKISGKIALEGTNWTFSAASYAAVRRAGVIAPYQNGGEECFIVEAEAKAGKATMPVVLEVAACDGGGTDGGRGAPALPNAVAGGMFGEGEVKMWRNMWKDKATASEAKATIEKFMGVYTVSVAAGADYGSGYMSLTVGKDGNVKASGKLADGTSVSANSPLMYDEDAGWFVMLYAAPSAYKGGSFAAAVGFEDQLAPVLFTPMWTSSNPQATGEYGEGVVRDVDFVGAYYDKLDTLRKYYESMRLELDGAPELGSTYKETSLNEYGKKVTTSSAVTAQAADTLGQPGLTVTVNEKGAIVVAKATKPVQDKSTKEWSYDGVNDGALTLSFTQATGIFKGSYTFWYDYVSAYDETKAKNNETRAHTSKKVSFEGILVQGEEPKMDGFYLWDATGEYEDPKTGKAKSYKYKQSFPVRMFAE